MIKRMAMGMTQPAGSLLINGRPDYGTRALTPSSSSQRA
jgi:hypothetical protein